MTGPRMRENPNQTIPLQLRCDGRKNCLRRRGMPGQVTGPFPLPDPIPGMPLREKKKKRKELITPSQGRSLLHGQDMGKTQTTETALNNGWRLAAVGG